MWLTGGGVGGRRFPDAETGFRTSSLSIDKRKVSSEIICTIIHKKVLG